MAKVRKAVIPAAGLGTRFLPFTKAVPKELLPIVDTPAIHYVVKEAVDAGVEQIIFISSLGKSAIEDYFDHNTALEKNLANKKKEKLLEQVLEISDMVEVSSVRQKKPLGLGHAVLCAEHLVGNEPFAVLLPDDIFDSDVPCIKQLKDCFVKYGSSVVGLMEVAPEDTGKYGIVSGRKAEEGVIKIDDMVEKPEPSVAPSRFAIPGRYVLSAGIFEFLKTQERGVGNEIQLTDAMKRMLKKEAFYGKVIDGRRFDVGNKLEYLKITAEFALKRSEFAEEYRAFLKELIGRN